MSSQLTIRLPRQVAPVLGGVPAMISAAGDQAAYRFVRFFVETIRNQNTRQAYARAVRDFFAWCEAKGLSLSEIEPIGVSAYVEQLTAGREPATVKQHLAAIRMLFDWLVTGGVVPFNPASSVRGPRMSYRRGKTPILDADECRQLIDSINVGTIAGIRDRALIGCLVYSFARVSAAIGMDRADYRTQGKKTTFRLPRTAASSTKCRPTISPSNTSMSTWRRPGSSTPTKTLPSSDRSIAGGGSRIAGSIVARHST
jgi:integrase/recombinase XerD